MSNSRHRFWMWLQLLFTGKLGWREIAGDAAEVAKKTVGKGKPYNHRAGRMFWDSRLGTYRRKSPKVGRNAPCPCGSMRVAPRNIEQQAKFKHCCGA